MIEVFTQYAINTDRYILITSRSETKYAHVTYFFVVSYLLKYYRLLHTSFLRHVVYMIQGQYLSPFYEEYRNPAQYLNTIDNRIA